MYTIIEVSGKFQIADQDGPVKGFEYDNRETAERIIARFNPTQAAPKVTGVMDNRARNWKRRSR